VYYFGASFTWDPSKAAINARKHRVAFEEAVTVFDDPAVYFEAAPRFASSAHERRRSMSAKGTKKAKTKRESTAPSKASLRDIPSFKNPVFIGRGKEGLRRVQELAEARRRGRPAKGATPEGTVAKTVRLAQSTYDELVRLAGQQGISAHVALRKAVANWIVDASRHQTTRDAAKPRKRARKVA
jgi:uncharacterized DUF497 family protein/predicted transcriptional regulator